MPRAASAAAVGWHSESTWPNLAQTARIIGVDRSTLAKQASKGRVRRVKRGLGTRRTSLVPPEEVLRLAVAFGRVPIEEVRRRLAREAAHQSRVDEQLLRRDLERIAAAAEGVHQQEAAMNRERAATTTERSRTREVSLGRSRPKAVPESEAISASLVEALDQVKHRQPLFRPGNRRAREVNLGRLRPSGHR